ncbi:MAG: hypothetical protein AAF202_12220, partial [Pseudomonadota bacterium]
GLSVARVYSKFSRKDRTILENDFIMVGDKIDMSTALMETQLKRKSAQQMPTAPTAPSAEPPKKMSQADFSSLSPTSFGPKLPPVEIDSMQ